jgi:hypothetical protein
MSDGGVGNKRIFGSMKGGEARIGPGFGGASLGSCNMAVARDKKLVKEGRRGVEDRRW